MEKKTKVKLTGTDGNVFAMLGKCTAALKKDKKYDEAKELQKKVLASHSYMEALAAMGEYCDVR